ncbi:MAG: class I SAM-dependent methyltransferase [Pseudomonadota bacterium]|nr:class I SAM-dependent methyltransferase [Pseudomonadota bacterium]
MCAEKKPTNFQHYEKFVKTKSWVNLHRYELHMLEPVFEHFCPFRCLYLGPALSNKTLKKNDVIFGANVFFDHYPADVILDYACFPFADRTFDLIICPHIHELSGDNIGLFRELSRVLVPEGLCVVLGINPSGMLQAGNYGGLGSGFSWVYNAYPPQVLRKMLTQYHFEFVYQQYGIYHLWLDSNVSLQTVSKWLPSAGGVYKLVFRLRELNPAYVGTAMAQAAT